MPKRLGGMLAGLIATVGCATTTISTTWKDSAYQGGLPRKVLVVAVVPNQSVRLQVEEKLAAQLAKDGFEAVPLSRLVPPGTHPSQEAVNAVVQSEGFGGLLLSHYKQTKTTVRSGGYAGYGPYAGGWQGAYFYPGYLDVTHEEQMETSLFDTRAQGRLIWTGTSSTSPSGSPGAAVSSEDISHYAEVVVGRLMKDLAG